jgi:hypothetical protein
MSLTVACVRTGTRYGAEYVYRLRDGVARHLKRPHRFVCLTDRPEDLPNVETIDVSGDGLAGWWAKMILFQLAGGCADRILYFDLDTVICGPLDPLADLDVEFGICGNFARAAGNLSWPCRYGSCVMTIRAGYGGAVWREFDANRDYYMGQAGNYGDQKAIEMLIPVATILQDVMPPRFFLGYRDVTERKPEHCSLVIFAGRSKPHNCDTQWIKAEWIQ